MTDMTNTHAAPGSTAERLASQVSTAEPVLDRRLATMSPAEHRISEVTNAMYAAGLNEQADASHVRRVAQGCRDGADVSAYVAEVMEAQPRWFAPTERTTASRTADRLTKTFTEGKAVPRRGQH